MNKTNKVLGEIKQLTSMEIINKSFDGIPLFDMPFKQPFKFNIEISFSSLKGTCSFGLHLPSLYVKSEEVIEFSNIINQLTSIINQLNIALKHDYDKEWVKQS